MVWAFDCIFLSIHSSYATPHGVVGRGDALVATDMEALTGFGCGQLSLEIAAQGRDEERLFDSA